MKAKVTGRVDVKVKEEAEELRIKNKIDKIKDMGFKLNHVLPKILEKGIDDFVKRNRKDIV